MLASLAALSLVMPANPTHDYPYQPVPFTAVHWHDDFWAPRIETNRAVTIPYAFEQSEQTGRIENFKVAGGLSDQTWTGGFGFNDSDVSKIMEGAAYALVVQDDPRLDAYLDNLISWYAAAQEDDGYLYTLWTARNTVDDYDQVVCRPIKERWDNINMSHELYNVGHMYEAAVAHYLATGKRTFLDVAIRNADLICRVFNEGGRHDPPGHQEIEIGLAKLYRVTGDQKYLDTARFFLEQRGRPTETRKTYGPYSQDHVPVTEQTEAVGHAVRANYMYAGMADVAALANDPAYVDAIGVIWDNVVSKKLYLTGGVGARSAGEAYGENYELPNESAYAETCAAIANIYWNHRMFCLHGDAKYIDVMERSLYNGVLSGVALDGKTFFYDNPLSSSGQHQRSPWFGCACCPSNITRFLASVGGYMYAVRDEAIYVNLYGASTAEVPFGRQKVKLTQTTNYPWDGNVAIEVQPAFNSTFELRIRVPGWAQDRPIPSDLYAYDAPGHAPVVLTVNGEPAPSRPDEHGYIALDREWRQGDTVQLILPMPVRRVLSNDRVEANRGRVALERGPLVYCVEFADTPAARTHDLVLPDDAQISIEQRPDLLGGVTTLNFTARSVRAVDDDGHLSEVPVAVAAIPYNVWSHRGRGEMDVWLARSADKAIPIPAPTIASQAKASASGGDVRGVNDQRQPRNSNDHDSTWIHWWPRKGTTEWVQYDFAQPTTVRQCEVYFFDDTGRGECRVPASWRLLARDGDEWRQIANASAYTCEPDRYNTVTFDPVQTTALRLEVKLKEGWSTGIHEWRVK
ncbi:MAG: glycoside hydrolase family 127 protein [Leptolyngbya sp. PLA3]|nr:MAG: glycoside hydrolase family 127 protein [Cyanobacteria bacterium CYA]MCE7968507.1 glycoside hydrolase family 127 protein [Leptolyngbya sp. PL-A3]